MHGAGIDASRNALSGRLGSQVRIRILDKPLPAPSAAKGVSDAFMGSTVLGLFWIDLHATDRVFDRPCCRWRGRRIVSMGMFHQ
jgi:hypothetical protein